MSAAGHRARAGRGAASAARLTGARPAGGGAAPRVRLRLGPAALGQVGPRAVTAGSRRSHGKGSGHFGNSGPRRTARPSGPAKCIASFPAKVARSRDTGLGAGGDAAQGWTGTQTQEPRLGGGGGDDPACLLIVVRPVLSVCFFWLF